MKYVLYAILIYLAYQLVFKLIIPVYLASRKIKKGFKEAHERMQEQQRQREEYFNNQAQQHQSASKVNPGDYIEFEEVR